VVANVKILGWIRAQSVSYVIHLYQRVLRTSRRMRSIFLSIAIMSCLLLACLASAEPPIEANVNASALADIRLPFTGSDEDKRYLGIGNADTVSIREIPGERLIIVVVNSFCEICQADAPMMNTMYEIVEKDPVLKGRTKIVGIAPGNTKMEVDAYRSSFRVPFPILADPDFTIDKAVGDNPRTPIMITAKRRCDRSIEVIQTHFGKIDDVELLVRKFFRRARGRSLVARSCP
jgi:hypothetical protein